MSRHPRVGGDPLPMEDVKKNAFILYLSHVMDSRLRGNDGKFVLGLFMMLFLPFSAHAQESIPYFHVTAVMGEKRDISITEEIRYDFGDAKKHGIDRFMPTTYARNGATYRLRPKIQSIQRDGHPEPYTQSRVSADMRLHIGDAGTTLSSAHTYTLTYQSDRAYSFFPDHDELYWNVTGNFWPTNIEDSTFTMKLAPEIDRTKVKTICYTGAYGSTESDCSVAMDHGDIVVKASRLLLSGEGLTVVVWLPVGSVPAPNLTDEVMMFVADNGSLFYPILAFIIMFYLWWSKGRDGRLGAIVPEYTSPDHLSAGVLASVERDEQVPQTAVTATILDLARRGYLTLRFAEEKKLFGNKINVTFVRSQKSIADTSPSEQSILAGMFADGDEQTPETLVKNKFYLTVAKYVQFTRKETEALKIYDASPMVTRPAYAVVAFGVALGLYAFMNTSLLDSVCAIATGLIIAIFGYFMPKRNAKGQELLRRIEGFKWFLSVTEKDRMSFHQAPSRTPEQFYALLPFAIIFGVEKEWAGQFKSMMMPAPDYAEGSMRSWNSVMFANAISDVHHDATRGMYSTPSTAGSGGSGFSGGGSGGGFGGGGGGSW